MVPSKKRNVPMYVTAGEFTAETPMYCRGTWQNQTAERHVSHRLGRFVKVAGVIIGKQSRSESENFYGLGAFWRVAGASLQCSGIAKWQSRSPAAVLAIAQICLQTFAQ